mmetsp:Transcript_101660/g.282979  ORF Transcript_101660/g.282979 Transcript_101660/m.282979 type:complete len:130 (+) Transcript_101660:85-474(+)
MSQEDATLSAMQNEVEAMEEQVELLNRLAASMTEMLKLATSREHDLEAAHHDLVKFYDALLNQGGSTEILAGRYGRADQTASRGESGPPFRQTVIGEGSTEVAHPGGHSSTGASSSSAMAPPQRWENCD